MISTLTLALSIFLIPLATFAVLAVIHKKIPALRDKIATAAIFTCLVFSCIIFGRAWHSESPMLVNWVFDWLPMTTGLTLQGGVLVDRLTAVMLVVVTLVSFLVHLFSTKYMAGDVRYGRYYCGLLLFTASMLGLVLANNMLFLFVAWELVGLSSYLLIGHWYEKKSASDAAIKAFLTTRVGDIGMFIGIMICYLKVGSLQYADLFAAVANGTLAGQWQMWAGIGIFLGAMGKSAQFPLHVWLPDAMEGPTPVSALIHAATMVAAGVYLVGRVLPMFDATTLRFIAYTGAFTALFAASIALVQDDIKKVLAYSTVSQLGYMIMALGVGGYVSGLFHLTTHAFFKAGLFLGSGAVIYAMHHEQSMSKYGGLWRKMPKTAACYLLATLAITGVPGLSGFFSKDMILGDVTYYAMSHTHDPLRWFLPLAGFTTAFMTAFYMFRQFFLTFTGKPRDHHAYDHAKESPLAMLIPLIVLGTLALVAGWGGWFEKMNPKLDGMAQVRLYQEQGYDSPMVRLALAGAPAVAHEAPAHEITTPGEAAAAHAVAGAHEATGGHGANQMEHQAHQTAMALSIILASLGILLGGLMYFQRQDGQTVINPSVFVRHFGPIYRLLWNKYYLDELYWYCLVLPLRGLRHPSSWFDRNIIDAVVNLFGWFGRKASFFVSVFLDNFFVDNILVMGPAKTTNFIGDKLSYAQTGRVRQYLVFSVVGIVVITSLIIYFF